jgi:hypothetical protein
MVISRYCLYQAAANFEMEMKFLTLDKNLEIFLSYFIINNIGLNTNRSGNSNISLSITINTPDRGLFPDIVKDDDISDLFNSLL